MSYDTLGVSDAMLDSLSLQLREAEARRADAERAHQVSCIFLNYLFSWILGCQPLSSYICIHKKKTMRFMLTCFTQGLLSMQYIYR